MATENKHVKLSSSDATFATMMKNGFGIVTVMNAKVYDVAYDEEEDGLLTPNLIRGLYNGEAICTLKTLKVANVTQEGPNKTVTGGQYSNPLIKFGKSARLEMQDALGNADAIEALGGATIGYAEQALSTISALHFSEQFAGPKTIIGDSFFIDQKTGKQIPVEIIFYSFLPDSIFNLTQDAEGDATVFDMNGDLMTTNVRVNDNDKLGLFYSIIAKEELESRLEIAAETGVVSIKDKETDETVYYRVNDGNWTETAPTLTSGQTVYVRIVEAGVVKAVFSGTYRK